MPPSLAVSVWLAAAALALMGGGLAALRRSGSRAGMARRMAGARQLGVGELLDLGPTDPLPPRPVRLLGRVRCADPIVTAQQDRLVGFHRDVEVALPGGEWRSIERTRETRSFEVWDHDGSLDLDPAEAAEPLVVLPHVWACSPDELDDTYTAAVARLTEEHGAPIGARATTRMLSVTDRLLVLATVRRAADGRIQLAAPRGGYLISSLDLDDAMRLLGG